MNNLEPEIPAAGEQDTDLLARFTTPRLSVEERMAMGKALHAQVPHVAHGEYQRSPNREDPVAILEE